MTTDVEITRDLLDSKIASQFASVSVLECSLGNLELPFLVGFLQQFEALPIVDVVALTV